MTVYDPPTDLELASGQPVTTGKAKRWRDMAIAIIEGAPGAPRATSRIITPGGAACDGLFVNASSFAAGIAYYDLQSFVRTATHPLAAPAASVVRIDGDSSLADIITVATCSRAMQKIVHAMGWVAPWVSPATYTRPSSGGHDATSGGSSYGLGAAAASVPAPAGDWGTIASFARLTVGLRPIVGGCSGDMDGTITSPNVSADGGGSIVILVHGNLDLTGGTIKANGMDGVIIGNLGNPPITGGGGGGTIFIVCTGTITGGTFEVKGGNGITNSGVNSPGGGGGFVGLMAAAFAGTQTFTVTGGVGPSGAGNGADGSHEVITLTESQINAMALR